MDTQTQETAAVIAPPAPAGGLVLTRRVDQEIAIGDDITVQVIEIDRGKVRLRVVAPKGVTVDRGEIKELIKQNGRHKKQKAAA